MKTISDKICIIISIILCIGFAIYAFGCQPETRSLLDPNRKVTANELSGEIEFLLARFESRKQDLEKQQELRNLILQQSFTIAQTGQINPLAIATSFMSLLGLGAVADDVRLRKERRKFLTYEPVKPNGNV